MTDLNKVELIGRLTRDLGTDERSFGYLQNGTARANISIAVNQSKKNGDSWVDDVNYFDVVIFGKTAENLKPYLTKGKQIAILGALKQDRWEKDGQKFSKVSIVADSVWLLGGKADGNNQDATQTAPNPTSTARQPAPVNPRLQIKSAQSDLGFDDGAIPEDIPF